MSGTNEIDGVRGKLVLLVDDDRVHQYSLGKHLIKSGFEVVHAHSGAETFEAIARQHPDVVLLDIHLPDVLGFEICRCLKANPETKDIPVVFHSATYDVSSARDEVSKIGGVSFLSYPIEHEHLLNVLAAAIQRGKN